MPVAGEASESDSDIGADCKESGDLGAEELRGRCKRCVEFSSCSAKTYASPSSSDSALRFFIALLAPPCLADAFGVTLDRSLVCGGENVVAGRGELALIAVVGACVVSSSEESSPPASARSSASSTSISGLLNKLRRSPLRPISKSKLGSQALH